ncbi:MAG: hypothetical protein HDR15_08830 [Lachnospiraceae bacterium]|nr:hypothetical protein [Lachnospiraceae bacterium]
MFECSSLRFIYCSCKYFIFGNIKCYHINIF